MTLDELKARELVQRRELMAKKKEELLKKQAAARATNSSSTSTATTSVSAAATPKVLRENYISNAVNFLKHTKVQQSPLGKRIAFLEHKGLNQDEITEALKRAGVTSTDIQQAAQTSGVSTIAANVVSNPQLQQSQQQSQPQLPARPVQYVVQQAPAPVHRGWGSIILGSVVAMAAGAVMTYLGTSWWNKRREEEDDKDQRISDLTQTVSALTQSQTELFRQLGSFTSDVKQLTSSQNSKIRKDRDDSVVTSLRSEVSTLRAMLTDSQTAIKVEDTENNTIPEGDVSLPSWQLEDLKEEEKEEEKEEKEEEKEEEEEEEEELERKSE